MSHETTLTPADAVSEILLSLGHHQNGNGHGAGISLDVLRKCTRDQLVEYARRLGLTGVTKLTKDVLAGRVQLALDKAPLGTGRPDAYEDPPRDNGGAPFPGKFDLGPDSHEEPTLVEFKLASNSQLKRNLENQVAVYEKAHQTTQSYKVILFFSAQEEAKVKRILQRLKAPQGAGIILIDARRDNRPSASKA